MDLFEYQATDLFADARRARAPAARSPRPPRRRAAAAERRSGAAAGSWSRRRSRPAAAARPAASSSPRPRRGGREGAPQILGMDIKGHTVHRVMVAAGQRHRGGVLLLAACSTAPTAPTSRWPRVEGGMEIEQLAVEKPEALARVPVDAIDGIDDAKAARDRRRRAASRPRCVDQVADVLVKLWDVFVGEDATLVEVNPLVKTADGQIVALDGKVTLDDNADFRHAGRTPASRTSAAADPLEAQGQGEGPQLRQARRRGRHHRQRRRPGHVDARRRRVRRRGARRRPAGQLPRHRRRRVGRGDGQRAGDHPRRPGREVGVRQRLRRHHRLRRGGQRHRAGVRACSTTAARRSRKPLVVRLDGNNAEEGRRILTEAALPLARAGRHDGRRRGSAPPSWPRKDDGLRHGDLPRPRTPRSSSRA